MKAREILSQPGMFFEKLYIGGDWRDASSGRRFPVFDPASEELLAEVADASPQDALDAVAVAYHAQQQWAQRSPRERAEVLRSAYALLIERREWYAGLMVLENGKTLAEARGEVNYAAEFFRWYSEEAARALGELSRAPGGQNKIMVLRQPIGVSVLVTPWNFPAAMATRKIAPALAAGCGMVLKPAPETPLTALALADLLREAGVPPGLVNVVPTSNASEVVNAALHDPRVRKLSFTGSTEVGRLLLGEASDQVLSCSMELGGNAPFIVFDDADVDAAVSGAMVAKMRNGGESCIAANRFYVHNRVYQEFADHLAAAMKALRLGHGLEEGVDVGPLINQRSVERVVNTVEETAQDGATILTGGKGTESRGYFYTPTVLTDVRPDASILKGEIFAPVAPLVPFDTEEEVLAQANDTVHGLAAYVYSGDLSRALRVAERLETGMVGVNRGFISDPAAPFGGVKQSGLGREGAHEGMLEFMESKYVAVDW